MSTNFRRNTLQGTSGVERRTPAFMRQAAVSNGAPVTALPVVVHKRQDLLGHDALINSALLVGNIARNIGGPLSARNEARTGECIAVGRHGERIETEKARGLLLPPPKNIHRNLILNRTQINL